MKFLEQLLIRPHKGTKQNCMRQELTQIQLFIFWQGSCRAQLIKDVIIALIIGLKHDPEHKALNTAAISHIHENYKP